MNDLLNEFKLSSSIGHIVNIVANKMRFELEQTFQKNGYDITAHQWMVLSIIYENEGISQNELSLKSKKDKTNTARIVEKLEGKKLIERIHSDNDKRVILMFTTESGRETKDRLSLLALDVIERSTQNITEREIGRAHV